MRDLKLFIFGPFFLLYAIFMYGFALLPVILLMLLVGGQCYFYLMYGEWISVSVIDVVSMLDEKYLTQPDSWVGVWKILNKTPLAAALVVLSAIFLNSFDDFHEAVKRVKKELDNLVG